MNEENQVEEVQPETMAEENNQADVSSENDEQTYRFSIVRMIPWVGLAAAALAPLMGLGLGILGLAVGKDDLKAKEIEIISLIVIAIATFMLILSYIGQFVMLN